jgi:hypothetical protein
MYFQFAPAIQAGIEAGKYLQVVTSAGIPIGMARDLGTGQFVAHAIGAVAQNNPLSPLVSPLNFVMGAAQMYQNHRGFTSVLNGLNIIQSSLGVLQATTAFIGVGTVAVGVLSAVNLYQTMKLREDIKQLRLEVKDGFIDLKQALKDQGTEIKELIEHVANDVEFRHHRTILAQAYGLFLQALHRFKVAIQLQDINRRNSEVDAVRGMLFETLADYANPQLLSETCSAGQLRRLECSWAIEQVIVITYQVQNEFAAVSDRLFHLQHKIRQDALSVIDACGSEDELDFLFPEIIRIHNHDLAILNSWQNHIDWMHTLPLEERHFLSSLDIKVADIITSNNQVNPILLKPTEQVFYENLKPKSHPLSLESQLKLMIEPALHQKYASYISQEATSAGYKTLVISNLQQVSDLAIANLYWYFKLREEVEKTPTDNDKVLIGN